MKDYIYQKITGIRKINTKKEDIFLNDPLLTKIRDAFFKTKKIWLKPSQAFAAIEMSRNNNIVQMDTGEGKTYAIATAAIDKINNNNKCIVLTIDNFLAEYGHNDVFPVFQELKIKSAFYNYENQYSNFEEIFNNNDIIYTTHISLAATISAMNTDFKFYNIDIEKDFDLIIDEIDVVCIEDNVSEFKLQQLSESEEMINEYKKIFNLISDFEFGENLDFFGELNSIYLTDIGLKKLEERLFVDNIFTSEYMHLYNIANDICSAFLAKNIGSYVIIENNVYPIDIETGKTREGSSIQNGVKQAIQIIENIKVSKFVITKAIISFEYLIKSFKNFSGTSGSVVFFADIFSLLYKKQVVIINKDTNKNTIINNDIVAKDFDSQIKKTIQLVVEQNKLKNPIIIGAANIDIASKIEIALRKAMLNVNNVSTKKPEEIYNIISNSGEEKNITIITPSNGRGLNIRNSKNLSEDSKMFFIGIGHNTMSHLDLQMQSRVGRNGDFAEIQWIVSFEDPLFSLKENNEQKIFLKNLNLDTFEYASSLLVSKQIKSAQAKATLSLKDSILKNSEDFYIKDQIRLAITKTRKNIFENMNSDSDVISFVSDIKNYLIKNTDFSKENLFKEENIFSDVDFDDNFNSVLNKYIQKNGLVDFCETVLTLVMINIQKKNIEIIDEIESISKGKWLQNLHPNKSSSLEFKKNVLSLFETNFNNLKKDLAIFIYFSLKN